MSMNTQKQKSSLLRAARWIEDNPDNWTTRNFFRSGIGFCAMGACYPNKSDVLNGYVCGLEVSNWVHRNFPRKVIIKITDLNDDAENAQHAARRIRAYVGRNFS